MFAVYTLFRYAYPCLYRQTPYAYIYIYIYNIIVGLGPSTAFFISITFCAAYYNSNFRYLCFTIIYPYFISCQ